MVEGLINWKIFAAMLLVSRSGKEIIEIIENVIRIKVGVS